MIGTVVEFDEDAGLGTVRVDDDETYPFHCTAIADGTRTIPVGVEVSFDLRPKLGRWEATALQPTADA